MRLSLAIQVLLFVFCIPPPVHNVTSVYRGAVSIGSSKPKASAASNVPRPHGWFARQQKSRTFADSLLDTVKGLLHEYCQDDTNARLIDFPDDVGRLPDAAGTMWDDSADTGFVKCIGGCRMVTLVKTAAGFSGYLQLRNDTLQDTIRISGCHFTLTDRLFFETEKGVVLTIGGDTVNGWGMDEDEPAWYRCAMTNEYMEFSDYPGTQVTLKALHATTDTLRYRCRNRESFVCLKKRGIRIVPYDDGALSALVGYNAASIVIDECLSDCDSSGRIGSAIDAINVFLRGKHYVLSPDGAKVRIYRKKSACFQDSRSMALPVGNIEK